MPKDYSRGKIYKIVCNITNKIYIGSTCEPTLARRLAKHVSNFKNWKNGKGNKVSSFQILEGGNYYIELLEVFSCTINEELLAKERFYIKSIDCINRNKNLNMTKEDKKEYDKIYRQNNKDKIKKIKKDYEEKNKNKINEYHRNLMKKNKFKVNCPKCNKEMFNLSLQPHLKKICFNEVEFFGMVKQ